jgi:hypothetical protein
MSGGDAGWSVHSDEGVGVGGAAETRAAVDSGVREPRRPMPGGEADGAEVEPEDSGQ